jgi:polysaccharide biosynthesis/export protein
MDIRRRIGRLASIALLVGSVACVHLDSHQGDQYVWIDTLDEAHRDAHAFRLQPGDMIRVDVWQQGDLSGNVRVRSDGKITVPLVGDVLVAGQTPPEAAETVAAALTRIVRDPKVVIGVVDVRPVQIGVLGEVSNPGMYQVDRGSGVLHAIAMAGGLTEFADPQRIFVIRKAHMGETDPVPIRFSYRMLVQARGAAADFVLAPGDIVVVE